MNQYGIVRYYVNGEVVHEKFNQVDIDMKLLDNLLTQLHDRRIPFKVIWNAMGIRQ